MTDEMNRDALEESLAAAIAAMDAAEPGSDEHEALMKQVEMLVKALNDQEKLDQESTKMTYQSLKDTQEEKERKIDRWLNAGLTALKIGVGAFGTWLGYKGFKLALAFESEGSFRSKAGLEALKRVCTGHKIL